MQRYFKCLLIGSFIFTFSYNQPIEEMHNLEYKIENKFETSGLDETT